jgi:PAS domain S-box-containing protein
MVQFQAELDQIKRILKSSSYGMSVTEIARTLNKNQHSVGRYLDILLVSGHVEMRMYGKAKVYSLSSRVPLNTMMGGLHDLILVLDKDNRIVRINDQFLQLLKKARKDLQGKDIAFIPFSETVTEIIFSSILSSLEAGLTDKEIVLNEECNRVYRQKIIPTVFEDGESGTIVLLEDISDRKSAEKALRASEEQFRLMADNIQDGIVIYRNKKLAYMNRRVEEIIGYSWDELIRLSPLDITALEDRDRIEQVLNHSSSTDNIPSEISFWMVRKDGTRRFVFCRITSLQHDNETVLYIVTTDMTEWKHAQDALENQLVFLQHMIDTFPNPLFYLDTQGHYLGCNSAFVNMTGKNFEDLAGKTDDEIGDPWDRDLFDRYNTELFKNADIKKYAGSFHHPDGHISEIIVQKSTMTTIEGTTAGIIGIILSAENLKTSESDCNT